MSYGFLCQIKIKLIIITIIGNRPKLCGNCAFPKNFHTRKSGEITVYFAVNRFSVSRNGFVILSSSIHHFWISSGYLMTIQGQLPRGVLWKTVPKISQNSQEKTCDRDNFYLSYISLHYLKSADLSKSFSQLTVSIFNILNQ